MHECVKIVGYGKFQRWENVKDFQQEEATEQGHDAEELVSEGKG